jgi:hypothetical protein
MSTKRRTERDRNYDRYERLRSRILDIYSRAKHYHWTHEQILAAMQADVWQQSDCAKLTRDYRAMLSEVMRLSSDRLYDYLEWRLGPQSGPIRTAGDAWTDEMSELCRIPGALYGTHFWKGTDTPFTPYKPTN